MKGNGGRPKSEDPVSFPFPLKLTQSEREWLRLNGGQTKIREWIQKAMRKK